MPSGVVFLSADPGQRIAVDSIRSCEPNATEGSGACPSADPTGDQLGADGTARLAVEDGAMTTVSMGFQGVFL